MRCTSFNQQNMKQHSSFTTTRIFRRMRMQARHCSAPFVLLHFDIIYSLINKTKATGDSNSTLKIHFLRTLRKKQLTITCTIGRFLAAYFNHTSLMGPTSSSSTLQLPSSFGPPPQRCCRDFRGSGGVVGRCQTTGKLVMQGLKYHGSMPAMNTHTHRKQPSEMDLMSRSARLSTKCLRLKNKIVQSSSLQTNMHHLILKRLILTRI